MNLMNIMLRKKRDIKVQLYHYIYIKFKNRQNFYSVRSQNSAYP